jgi:hypothetical protein
LRGRGCCTAPATRDALAYLVDACVTATPSALTTLLSTITAFGMRGLWPDAQQSRRLQAAVDHAFGDGSAAVVATQPELSCGAALLQDVTVSRWQLFTAILRQSIRRRNRDPAYM